MGYWPDREVREDDPTPIEASAVARLAMMMSAPAELESTTAKYTTALVADLLAPAELHALREEFASDDSNDPATIDTQDPAHQEVQGLLLARDWITARARADEALRRDGSDHVARAQRTLCEIALGRVHLVGTYHACPATDATPLAPFAVDQAILLSHIDPSRTVDELLDACGLGRVVALRVLYDLVARGVARIERRRS